MSASAGNSDGVPPPKNTDVAGPRADPRGGGRRPCRPPRSAATVVAVGPGGEGAVVAAAPAEGNVEYNPKASRKGISIRDSCWH